MNHSSDLLTQLARANFYADQEAIETLSNRLAHEDAIGAAKMLCGVFALSAFMWAMWGIWIVLP